MINNINKTGQIFNTSNQNLVTQQQNSESISIFSDSSKKLSKEEKKALKQAEKEERNRIKNNPDGIIQGGRQGSSAGDCWLLAQMNSMSKTDWGKEALKNAITKDANGNFTLHFKGANKDITVTLDEFKKGQKNSKFSSGDADALLLEIAVEKHFKAENINSGSIYGNDLAGEDSLQYLLTGAKGRQTNKEEVYKQILLAMAKSPENNAGIAATYIYYDQAQGSDGISHAISVQKVILNDKGDIKEVVLLDSYKPDSPFKKSYGQFVRELQCFGYTTKPNSKQQQIQN